MFISIPVGRHRLFGQAVGRFAATYFIESVGLIKHRYEKPSIEDIELGYRMKRMGYRILLDKDLQVKHLKQWSLLSLLRADILYRAVPWSELIIKSGDMINDLNLQFSAKISAILIALSVGLLPVILFKPQLIYLYIDFSGNHHYFELQILQISIQSKWNLIFDFNLSIAPPILFLQWLYLRDVPSDAHLLGKKDLPKVSIW